MGKFDVFLGETKNIQAMILRIWTQWSEQYLKFATNHSTRTCLRETG